MQTEELDYITRCKKCGGINSALASNGSNTERAKIIAKWVKDGHSVERATSEQIRTDEWCKCWRK